MIVEILALALTALIGLSAFLFKQRNDARSDADRAKERATQEKLARELVERTNARINEGKAEVKADANKLEQTYAAYKASGTRPRQFGDPRLYNPSAGPDTDTD